MASAECLLIGIGHPFRCDDGAGPAVAEAVAARSLPGLAVLVHHGEGTDLMERWQGYDRVILVDATCGGAAAGTIGHWDGGACDLPAGLFPKSSHTFGLAEAVAMARLLGRLPPSLRVIGIEGARFEAGQEMTDAVRRAVAQVAEDIAAEC